MSRNHPIQDSEQNVLNKAYIPSKKAIATTVVSTDGVGEKYPVSSLVATKTTVIKSGSITTIYEAIAPIGTAQSAALWQVKKTVSDSSVTDTTTLTETWADSNDNFDNVATDLTALTYG